MISLRYRYVNGGFWILGRVIQAYLLALTGHGEVKYNGTHMTDSSRTMQIFGDSVIRLGAIMMLFAGGCGSPSSANIELRKKQQTLQSHIDQLNDQHTLDVQALAACEQSHPTTASLPQDLLQKVVTTHGLKFGELTGGNSDPGSQSVDTGLKVYIVPIDGDGVPIKAAGSFRVEVFDLNDSVKTLIGTWNFDDAKVSRLFYSQLLLYTYVLDCPWTTQPRDDALTVLVTFSDMLTGRVFSVQKQVKVRIADVRH